MINGASQNKDIMSLHRETNALSLTTLHPEFDIVCKRNHANRLPNTKTDARRDTPVETFNAVFLVDEGQRVQDREFCRAVSSLRHGLHLATRQSGNEMSRLERNTLQHGRLQWVGSTLPEHRQWKKRVSCPLHSIYPVHFCRAHPGSLSQPVGRNPY